MTDTRLDERSRDEILTPDALDFVAHLHREFGPRRKEILEARIEQQQLLDGGTLDLLPDTRDVRDGEWRVAPPRAAGS